MRGGFNGSRGALSCGGDGGGDKCMRASDGQTFKPLTLTLTLPPPPARDAACQEEEDNEKAHVYEPRHGKSVHAAKRAGAGLGRLGCVIKRQFCVKALVSGVCMPRRPRKPNARGDVERNANAQRERDEDEADDDRHLDMRRGKLASRVT